MKTLIASLWLAVLTVVCCPGVYAAAQASGGGEKASWKAPELNRGSTEVLNCAYGKTSDKEVVECISSVVDKSIQDETDSLPFLVGAYFAGWHRLTASTPTAGLKDKWLKICYSQFNVMQKEVGLEDKELCDATGIYYSGVQSELEKMRQ